MPTSPWRSRALRQGRLASGFTEHHVSEESREHAQDVAAITREQRLAYRRLASMFALLALIGFVLETRGAAIDSFLHGEIDIHGEPIFVPRHAVRPSLVAQIDLERLHARVLPEWLIRQSYADTPAGRRRAEYAYRDLIHTISPDPNLEGLWRELHDRIVADPIANAHRIDYLLWAHDDYMDRIGAPYRIEPSMYFRTPSDTGGRLALVARSYRVITDLETRGGARVRVLSRIDRTGPIETWLGHTEREQEGAFVVADRVLHFTVRHVWPALNPALDERLPEAERGLARGVRREVHEAVEPYFLQILEETAEDQQALMEAAASIEARHACGSTFRIFGLPYRGLSLHSRAMLRLALLSSQNASCPDVTLDEVVQLVSASERLRRTDDLEPALEALVALVSSSIAAHELRHVVDGPSEDLDCPGCADGTPPLVRAELSGYLASFGTPGVGYLAALAACSNPERELGVDAVAIAHATYGAMPEGCLGPAPDDLYARARAAERRYFGVRDAVEVPRAFPAALAVLPTSRVGLAGTP
jgi:hypothetical protein